jgi:hypothetical protein
VQRVNLDERKIDLELVDAGKRGGPRRSPKRGGRRRARRR